MALFDAFLKIEGIKGEIKGEIGLESFSWGLSNSISRNVDGGGAGAGKIAFQDFHFTSKLGSQSPDLFLHAAQGTNFANAQLTINGQRQMTVSFFDVFISEYKEDLNFQPTVDGGASPLESVSLNFAKVEIQVGGKITQKG
ncbi:MAG: type VI secretion system tube protein Hcp [Acidobacteriia bacterium]|nr:type VI secretion system tube protein Hcp [Terriglobia bacterium]